MRRLHLVVLLLLAAAPAQATPFFARLYGFQCQTCHSGYPRLNQFGLAFKENNFRIPGSEKNALLAWQKTVPAALQVKPTLMFSHPGSVKTEFTDIQTLGGGLLTRSTAFYIHHSALIDEEGQPFPTYEGWIQQVVDQKRGIMVKGGQFELPYSYSPVINLTTISTPLVLGAAAQGNDVLLGLPMTGFQVTAGAGHFLKGYLAYGAPSFLSPGTRIGRREFFGRFRDLFVRGEVGRPGRNVGLFGYWTYPPRDPTMTGTDESARRFGLDGSVFWKGFQVQGMAAYGEDSNPTGNGHPGHLRSGFLEVDRMLLPWIGVTGRLEAQTVNTTNQVYSDAKIASLRIYPNQYIRLVAEYQALDHGAGATAFVAGFAF